MQIPSISTQNAYFGKKYPPIKSKYHAQYFDNNGQCAKEVRYIPDLRYGIVVKKDTHVKKTAEGPLSRRPLFLSNVKIKKPDYICYEYPDGGGKTIISNYADTPEQEFIYKNTDTTSLIKLVVCDDRMVLASGFLNGTEFSFKLIPFEDESKYDFMKNPCRGHIKRIPNYDSEKTPFYEEIKFAYNPEFVTFIKNVLLDCKKENFAIPPLYKDHLKQIVAGFSAYYNKCSV